MAKKSEIQARQPQELITNENTEIVLNEESASLVEKVISASGTPLPTGERVLSDLANYFPIAIMLGLAVAMAYHSNAITRTVNGLKASAANQRAKAESQENAAGQQSQKAELAQSGYYQSVKREVDNAVANAGSVEKLNKFQRTLGAQVIQQRNNEAEAIYLIHNYRQALEAKRLGPDNERVQCLILAQLSGHAPATEFSEYQTYLYQQIRDEVDSNKCSKISQ